MAAPTALAGLIVLDVTQVMAGPFCSMMLADLGASVIKIEPPTGDSTRQMPGAVGTESPGFNAVNRGKRSVVLNLKTREGRDVFTRLARTADIVVENYRPGVMASHGLDYAALAPINPRLIYASISGYGQTGPDHEKGGFDLIAQGVSGIMSITGEPGRPPVKVGVPLTDLGAGLFALSGILAALQVRHRTGAGQLVDTSLVEAGIALSIWEATEYFTGAVMPGPMGSAHRMNAPYQAVQCSDGYVTIGGANDRTLTRLCRVLGHPEWTSMPEFADNATRTRNQRALAERIEAITRTKPRSHWLAEFTANDVPCGPINNYGEVFADPQIASRQMMLETDHPTLGKLKTLGSPLKLSATPTNPTRRAPLLGEHTREVLREAGFGDPEIDALYRQDAIR